MNGIRVSKYDDRMELLGTIDELSSQIGLAKVVAEASLKERLSRIQKDLIQMMAQIAAPAKKEYQFTEDNVRFLEQAIDDLENSFPRTKAFILYGGCEQSARLDVARAVARRAERRFWKVAKGYNTDPMAMQYINRLSDYLYMEARYADYNGSK